jgi:type IV secretory pathway TrbD component
MSVRARCLTERQYTDTVLLIGADHVVVAASGDAMVFLAIPALWIAGVIVFIAFKFHSR